jgi:hypothetical protein
VHLGAPDWEERFADTAAAPEPSTQVSCDGGSGAAEVTDGVVLVDGPIGPCAGSRGAGAAGAQPATGTDEPRLTKPLGVDGTGQVHEEWVHVMTSSRL